MIMVNKVGVRAARSPEIMNRMIIRISDVARQRALGFKAAGANVLASHILPQQVKRLVYCPYIIYEDNEPFFLPGVEKLKNVTDEAVRNTLMQFSPQRLFIMSAFSEVLKIEREEGLKWAYAESISGAEPVSLMALTFKGSILHRTFDEAWASLFNYMRAPGKDSFGIVSPFSGKLIGDVSMGSSIRVEMTEESALETSTVFQLAGLRINGPEDIEAARGTWDLMAGVLNAMDPEIS